MGCATVAVWGARGLALLGGLLVIGALAWSRRRGSGGRALAAALLLVLAHPGIWMAPGALDCGAGLVKAAGAFTALIGVVAAWTALRPVPED